MYCHCVQLELSGNYDMNNKTTHQWTDSDVHFNLIDGDLEEVVTDPGKELVGFLQRCPFSEKWFLRLKKGCTIGLRGAIQITERLSSNNRK